MHCRCPRRFVPPTFRGRGSLGLAPTKLSRRRPCHFWPKEDAARLRGQPFLACLRRCKRVAAFGRVCSNSPSGERASGKPTVRSGAVKCVAGAANDVEAMEQADGSVASGGMP